MTGAGAADRTHYRAFISYSHRDSAFANRLHRRLEGYVLPKSLGGNRRLTPIFKDREELPAAHDLSAQVRAALDRSDCLIVVCSPDAAASPWVKQEIETFRSHRPDEPILAALIRGEPGEAFPAALLSGGIEPLAADFRKQADGERLAFLKLAAGIAGVGVDRLVQRDAQRRLQHVTLLTAASVAGMIAMAAMTTYALTARAEADRQRAEAEGLIAFMATDLMERLEGVARLEVLGAVSQRSLDYYRRQDLSRLSAASLQKRAELLQDIGDVYFKGAQYDSALDHFVEARRVTAALLAADPENPERIKAQGISEYWVGLVDWKKGRTKEALAAFERYAEHTRRLIAVDPTIPEWQAEAGYAESNLGTLALRDFADPGRAWPHFENALRYARAAADAKPDHPGFQRDLADAYGWLADCRRDLEDWKGALAFRRREAAIAGALQVKYPKNVKYARDMLGVNLAMGQLELALGRNDTGRQLLARTYDMAVQQSASDPQNQHLAQQRVAIGLALVRAIWADPEPTAKTRAEADRLLGACATAAKRDEELRDICMLLRAQRANATQSSDPEAQSYIASRRSRLTQVRRSPRWGFDFFSSLQQLKPGKAPQ